MKRDFENFRDSKPVEIADLFRQNFPDDTSKTTAADDFTTPVTIVLILISAVLLVVLIIAAVVMSRQVSSQHGCFHDYNKPNEEHYIPERIQAGSTLLTVFSRENITLKESRYFTIPFFIELHAVALVEQLHTFSLEAVTDVTLDGNELEIQLKINYTDDYDPVLRTNLSFQTLEGGNTDSAFQISLGIISVGRFISYRQETKFELNVSVTTYSVNSVDSPGRQGSTIVVVNILDIDDSDPVFDNLEYTLHVQEENSTAINVTHLTIPPVFAFDQDTGINDNITYSINGPSDVVDIHNETGQVWVTCVLDREVNPYVKVGIKANQVHNSWRSAVATLLVVVDDINDNRPKFQPDNPTLVRIPEHSAFGSSVVRVLALDEDVGENALFNYTVDAPEGTFYIETDNLDKPRYGTVIVTNSSALDRETISSLTITVGTVEYTPAQGGDCSTGMCNITITIQLTDINDNSPVFQNVTYSLTINASDADEGENADLRYRCVSSSLLGADACAVMRCTTVPVTVALDLEVHVTSYNFTVHENLPAGTYVGDILIYNSLFTLQHDEFELDEKTLLTTKPLDRETDNQFMLIINTNNQNNTNISVLVTVLDVNDNSPVFINSSYVLVVMDNSMDAFLETVNASDADEGENADLHYKCVSYLAPVSDGCSVVTVSNTTGDVRLQRSLSYNDPYTFQDDNFELNQRRLLLPLLYKYALFRTLRTTIPLDREDRDKYTLAINTNNKNNTNISVLVTVLDVNDNSPVFNNTSYRLTVIDNWRDAFVETDIFLVNINASDADEGENAVLRYSYTEINTTTNNNTNNTTTTTNATNTNTTNITNTNTNPTNNNTNTTNTNITNTNPTNNNTTNTNTTTNAKEKI
ncbi:hypothetical protein C0Q70_10934 [Pomacea canaliculata]|uniref:Cadherin domain-containing protein n=1 Tax=Pomacea canaliculata TaxID=400727 RepID=A0A2T7P4J7_POMCA|nr:hypothetical protein C0Q70_10934 [Pomacea canaliculata]